MGPRMIDVAYDFREDSGGAGEPPVPPGWWDADKHSGALHSYHWALWSRSVPDGGSFDLTDGRADGGYLRHNSVRGDFLLRSDALGQTFTAWKRDAATSVVKGARATDPETVTRFLMQPGPFVPSSSSPATRSRARTP
jgi:hypothetical protein